MSFVIPDVISQPKSAKDAKNQTSEKSPRHTCPSRLRRYLKPGHIITDIPACRKETAFRMLISLLEESSEISNLNQFTGAFMKKEARSASVVSKGVTIPHLRDDRVLAPVICLGTSSQGVSFDGPELAHLIALIAWPQRHEQVYLKTVAELAGLLHQKTLQDQIVTAPTPGDVHKIMIGQRA